MKIYAKILIVCMVLFLSSSSASAWYNVAYLNATFLPANPATGIFSVNMSNAVGTNNNTYIFTNGHNHTNFTDLVVALDNSTTGISYWFDNDTSQSGGNVVLWINKSMAGTSGIVGIFYNNVSPTTLPTNFNLTKVMPYADGWNGKWNYTYTQGAGANQNWATQPNGTMMQTNPTGAANKNFHVLQTTMPANYLVSTKMKVMNIPTVSGRGGVQLGRDASYDIGAGISAVSVTAQNTIYQDNNAFGTAATNTKNIIANDWFMVDGYTTGVAEQSMIYVVNKNKTAWQGSGAYTSSTTKNIGMYSAYDAATAYQYWYAWNGTAINLGTWGSEASVGLIGSNGNNYTNDAQTTFSVLTSLQTNFNVSNTTIITDRYEWSVNGTNQSWNFNNFTYGFPVGGLTTINATAVNVTYNSISSVIWQVTANNYTLALVSPPNTTSVSNPITLMWQEWPLNPMYTYQIATDPTFLNIVITGTGTTGANQSITTIVTLPAGITYYWHVKNSTGVYTTAFEFTVNNPAIIPGQLNVTALDEQNFTRINTFTVQLYNSTSYVTKTAVSGWANFTSLEVSSGQYLVIVVPNSTYAQRAVLATSPNNVTLYLPTTIGNTIDTVAFYLLDYTNTFPFLSSYLTVTKGGNIMHSAYFDADAKVAVNLIRGNSYTITVSNPTNNIIQQWGNYISTGSGNVEVVVMNLGVNQSIFQPYTQQINTSSSEISVSWQDRASVLQSLNFTVYKDNVSNPVYNLVTSISTGSATYIVTNTSAIYFTTASATTTQGYRNDTRIMDLSTTDLPVYHWTYGALTIPDWIKNAFAIIILFMLSGSFGALHRGEGAIITGIYAVFLWYYHILSLTGATGTLFGGLILFAILYHLETKRRQGGYY